MKSEFITKINEFGRFNNWNGYLDLYFTKKQLGEIKKIFGFNAFNISLKEAGVIINKQSIN